MIPTEQKLPPDLQDRRISIGVTEAQSPCLVGSQGTPPNFPHWSTCFPPFFFLIPVYDKVSWCLSWRTGALTNTCTFIWTDSGPVRQMRASNYGERKHGILNLTPMSMSLQRLSVTPMRVDWIDPKVISSRSKPTHLPPPISHRHRIKAAWLLSRANISTHGMVHDSVELSPLHPFAGLHDSIGSSASSPKEMKKRC